MRKSRLLYFYIVFLLIFPHLVLSQSVVSKHGMVVSEQYLASQVGVDILRAGGNAIDAAVAVGYALAVVNPCCGNIGGGGFMTIHLANGKNIFLNFRERAPFSANQKMFLDAKGNVVSKKALDGYLAVAVPGTVKGFETILKKYGTKNRQEIIGPAIKLAEEGFVLTSGDVSILEKYTNIFQKQPNVAAIFLKNNQALQEGDRLIQKDLANTLKLISKKGESVFYKGQIADAIVASSQQNGGILSKRDFSDYSIEEVEPILCSYRGYTIVTAAPPSAGGITLCEMLNILEGYTLKTSDSPQSIHYIVEAMRQAYFDRNKLGDPDFVKDPVDELISKEYANQIRKKINLFHASDSSSFFNNTQNMHTTHYSVLDKLGNAVSVTYTLNSLFGAKVIAGNTGFLLNNEMDDFTLQRGEKNQFELIQGENNLIRSGKRPLSSMAPTIILNDKKVFMILGSPGGSRIPTTILLGILNVIDFGKNIQDAVNAPRFHHQWFPDVIEIEPFAFSLKTQAKLRSMGYKIFTYEPWGVLESIYVDPDSNVIYGASDPRRPAGKAVGLEHLI